MCTGLEVAALVGAGASTYSAIDSGNQARKASRNAAEQAANAEKERKAAADKAAQDAYASTKFAREALRSNSLFTGGGTTGSQQTLGV